MSIMDTLRRFGDRVDTVIDHTIDCPPEQPDHGVMRFATVGGAVVTVTYSGGLYDVCCDGCDWTHPDYSAKRYARDAANDHAGECRSMPKPTD